LARSFFNSWASRGAAVPGKRCAKRKVVPPFAEWATASRGRLEAAVFWRLASDGNRIRNRALVRAGVVLLSPQTQRVDVGFEKSPLFGLRIHNLTLRVRLRSIGFKMPSQASN